MISNKIKKNRGFTLINLILGSFLAFLVVNTAIDLVFTSSKSTESKAMSTKLQQEGLFVSMIITNNLYKAGDLDYGISSFMREPFDWDKTGLDNDNNDELAIRFHNHNNQTDCSGNNNIGVLVNHYTVSNNKLYCNNVELIDNVERFNIYFGVDISGDGNVDRFVDRNTAYTLNRETDKRVISLTYSLLLKSEKELTEDYDKSFNFADGSSENYLDGNIYRYFKRTILLRNML